MYPCVVCGKEIASDAYRCPNCGTAEAGERAFANYFETNRRKKEALLDKTDPGWRERERNLVEEKAKELKQEKQKSSSRLNFGVFLGFVSFFLSAAFSGSQHNGFTGKSEIFFVQLPGFLQLLIIFGPLWIPIVVVYLFFRLSKPNR